MLRLRLNNKLRINKSEITYKKYELTYINNDLTFFIYTLIIYKFLMEYNFQIRNQVVLM